MLGVTLECKGGYRKSYYLIENQQKPEI